MRSGNARTALLVVSLAVIAEAAISGRAEVERRVAGLGGVWRESRTVLDLYGQLRSHRGEVSDLAGLYSPLAGVQRGFRNHPDFAEAEEFFGLLRDRLKGRPVELGTYRFDNLVAHPDTFYFLGGVRSVSGITSPKNSLWLRSEREAWIAKVAGMRSGCLFFDADSNKQLVDAWMRSVKPPQTMDIEPIPGRREYGILACKSSSRPEEDANGTSAAHASGDHRRGAGRIAAGAPAEIERYRGVILEARTRAYVEARVRAGVLEHGTVGLLEEAGVAGRLHREGWSTAGRTRTRRRALSHRSRRAHGQDHHGLRPERGGAGPDRGATGGRRADRLGCGGRHPRMTSRRTGRD